MRKKTEAEILDKKLAKTNLFQILMIVFLIIAVISTTAAIITSTRFKKYKNTLEHGDKISLVMRTRKMSDEDSNDLPILNNKDYGGPWISGEWKGKSLYDFLKSNANFQIDNSGFIYVIKGFQLKNYSWMIYSHTDPSGIGDDLGIVKVGIKDLLLIEQNVYYFALQPIKPPN